MQASSLLPHSGLSQSQHYPGETCDIDGRCTSPSPPPPTPPARSTKRHINAAVKSQKAAQLAKQELLSKVREDWVWPPIAESPCLRQALNLPTESSAWQARKDGFETDLSPEEALKINPYQYESADAVKVPLTVARSKESKKRKRREMLWEEMGWNEGLRCFVERRNLWCGARECQSDSPVGLRGENNSNVRSANEVGPSERDVLSKRNAIDGPSDPMKGFKADTFGRDDASSSVPLALENPLNRTLVPLAPPIFQPDNVVRASITPATYPSIYSKIVIQGLTPTVPINLHDIVGALVKGWKDNDEWPPKNEVERAAMAEGDDGLEGLGASMSTGMKNGVRKRMGKVKRALHLSSNLNGGDDGNRDVGVDEALDHIRQFDEKHG